jgi:hypothetical protein
VRHCGLHWTGAHISGVRCLAYPQWLRPAYAPEIYVRRLTAGNDYVHQAIMPCEHAVAGSRQQAHATIPMRPAELPPHPPETNILSPSLSLVAGERDSRHHRQRNRRISLARKPPSPTHTHRVCGGRGAGLLRALLAVVLAVPLRIGVLRVGPGLCLRARLLVVSHGLRRG